MNIDQYSPQSGRFLKEDGTYINIADALGGTETGQIADIEKHAAHSGRFIKEDGTVINIAESIGSGGGGGGSSDDSAPPIVETYNGQTIQCFMSADRPLQGLNLYATCEQKTTTGANLFDGSEYGKKTSSGVTIEWLQDEGCFLLNGTMTETNGIMTSIDIVAEKGATYALQNYYVSGEISVPADGSAVTCFGASDTEGLFNDWLGCSLKEEDKAATAQCNYNYITRFWFFITIGVVLNNYKVRIQLAKSSTSLPYEPYTGGVPSPNVDYPQEIQTIPDFTVEVKNSMGGSATPQMLDITIPEQGFYGIPVESGGNYTDSSGQRWICDEFDFKNKKFIKRTGRIYFDGSADERWIGSAVTEDKARFYAIISNEKKESDSKCLCNRLIYGTTGKSGSCFVSNSRFYIDIEPSINSVELLKEYLKTHQLDVIYSLETPIEIDISGEEIQAFKELHTYKPNTTIMSDSEPQAGMKVEYALDMKTYVDNKFLELATQVLENA